jgi:phosphotransferase system HPr-like phosphotransfer protein
MGEASLEEVISEKIFAGILAKEAEMFFRLANTLLSRPDGEWSRRHFFQLISEADTVEALLDDYGARYNRTYSYLRELVASQRSFALAGFSLTHLERRIEGYPTVLSTSEFDSASASIRRTKSFLQTVSKDLLQAACDEAAARGVRITDGSFPESRYGPDGPKQMLPRNMGQEDLTDDEQKVAEVASKFVQVATMFEQMGVRRIANEHEREAFLQRCCSEEQARVYEAAVHNLQSAYDTWVKNTRIEAGDGRLPKLRGHASAALHLLEAVTHLTHFVERHESKNRDEPIVRRIAALVNRGEVRDITLNHLLFHAALFMRRGRSLAEDLLPSYTNVQVLQVDLRDDLTLHARPAALIVGIVNRYGTPVELEVGSRVCNAASILDMMVTVGSNPDARRLLFRGDENPLRDIEMLFRSGLGEDGLEKLPPELAYLRHDR